MAEALLVIRRISSAVVFTVFFVLVFAPAPALPSPVPELTGSALDDAQKITMMTYNIQQLGYANWMANHFEKQRLALIPEAIEALSNRPDVLIMQEVFTEHSFTFLVNKMSEMYPYHTQVAGEDCKDPLWGSVSGNCKASFFKSNSGVLIFSRWPIEQQHAYVFNAVRVSKTFDFMAQKGVVYAKIQVEAEKPLALHVFGTHLQASVEEHDIRLRQLGEMRAFVDSFNIPSDDPVILAGDFNISSSNKERLKDLFSHAVARVSLAKNGIGSISDSTNAYQRLIRGTDAEIRPDRTLDYVLYRTDHRPPINDPTLHVIELKSEIPWIGRRLFKPDIELTDLSDHYPTLVELEF